MCFSLEELDAFVEVISFHRKYHALYYRPGVIEHAKSPAGEKGRPRSPHFFESYSNFFRVIPGAINDLSRTLTELRKDYEKGNRLGFHKRKFCNTIQFLRIKYEYFFTCSDYKFDNGMNKRKKMLRKTYFDLECLKHDVLDIAAGGEGNFADLQKRIEKQAKTIENMLANFRRYHRTFVLA